MVAGGFGCLLLAGGGGGGGGLYVQNLEWQIGADEIWHPFLNNAEKLVQIPRLWHKSKHRW